VLVALAANALVTVAKLAGGMLSGSAAMLAEAAHSLIGVGLLLIGVAGWMAHDTSELLIGAAARPAERAALERVLEESDHIDQVIELLTMVLGPNSLLVAARVDFAGGLLDEQVERASDEIERSMREVVPDVTEVFLDATTTPSDGRRAA
jgi:divalent metal cation (Fe/Co/Zn/Cd) transporter